MLKIFNVTGIIVLLLLLRKLVWCLRWLWCWHRGRETPAPISFFPRRTGETFDGHIRRDREDGPGNLE